MTKIKTDDTMINDIPHSGEGLILWSSFTSRFMLDRNDNPEEFCILHPEFTDFCEVIGDLCDENGSIKPDDEYCRSES